MRMFASTYHTRQKSGIDVSKADNALWRSNRIVDSDTRKLMMRYGEVTGFIDSDANKPMMRCGEVTGIVDSDAKKADDALWRSNRILNVDARKAVWAT